MERRSLQQLDDLPAGTALHRDRDRLHPRMGERITFAEREKVDFTDDEIKATIIAGLNTMKEVGKDFTYQTKMMK